MVRRSVFVCVTFRDRFNVVVGLFDANPAMRVEMFKTVSLSSSIVLYLAAS